MRETSLDDFIGGADEDEGKEEPEARDEDDDPEHDQTAEESPLDESSGGEPAESEVDEAGSDSAPDPVEPAVSTYDWTPTGADCEACGAAVERRWRDDGRLVCADCKAW